MDSTNTLHWMHISDLHRGQERTEEVWSVVRQEIHADIKAQIERAGTIDLVVFSGDMAFSGAAHEFSSVQKELELLWAMFAELGFAPKLFIVPGNHDLVRPSKTSALLNFADILRLKEDVRDELLDDESSPYRSELNAAFENYTGFLRNVQASGIPLVVDKAGIFPGDSSSRISVNGLNVGLVGLNSAWTHLGKGELKGKLDISVRQLNALVDNDLPCWSMQNHVNLLVTHHPISWLNPESIEEFEGKIFIPEYFDAHMYGHMHDNHPEISSVGAHNRRVIQAASLFGLEKIKGVIDRRHGYYFARLSAETNICWFWPRRFEKKVGNVWQVAADSQLLSRDERHFEQPWKVREVKGVYLKKA
ncbi:metallophosphoesterase family protein [Pseudomonas protegens]|uniref:metallophosphoesterase family protein n=1 Tax=Pseudomonas protegens TaxID=380021 RepID=UPI00200DC8DD|nr:metallophosphoesterase [Pseudomonas protegens]